MTTLREAAQQALEALMDDQYRMVEVAGGHYEYKTDLATGALKAALAQEQAAPDTCTWHQDGDSDSGVYATSCRHYFSLEDGTPEDNKMQWCCYCGKQLAQELIAENSDD